MSVENGLVAPTPATHIARFSRGRESIGAPRDATYGAPYPNATMSPESAVDIHYARAIILKWETDSQSRIKQDRIAPTKCRAFEALGIEPT